jgi:8-amino-7-oxononanoate synthase
MYNDSFLEKRLSERVAANALRVLTKKKEGVDFCSNDYLGIATKRLLQHADLMLETGSGGSRLLAGNYDLIEETEQIVSKFHNAQAGIIYNSGYDANIGLLSAIANRSDIILYDQLSHASLRDGIVLSKAQAFAFKHNDLEDIERKLQLRTGGNCFIVTESLFSMDGDSCDITQLVALAKRYDAHLIIDEAHATGIVGNRGEGLVQLHNCEENIFARVHTFGKALGCHGAIVLGSHTLKNYLINFSRSLMYTTSLPSQSVAAIKASYQLFPTMDVERAHLASLVKHFQHAPIRYPKINSNTAIQGVVIPGNAAVKAVAAQLQEAGMDVRPILYPTVPKGEERLRIILHAFNSVSQLNVLIGLLQ